jgi:hypothetical protein
MRRQIADLCFPFAAAGFSVTVRLYSLNFLIVCLADTKRQPSMLKRVLCRIEIGRNKVVAFHPASSESKERLPCKSGQAFRGNPKFQFGLHSHRGVRISAMFKTNPAIILRTVALLERSLERPQ